MNENFVEKYVGVHPADAEQVEVSFAAGSLRLRYVDWQEQQQEVTFHEVLAFRWQEQDESATPRDDTTYEIENSAWLASQLVIQRHGVQYAHYKICFNACGVLDVLCKSVPA